LYTRQSNPTTSQKKKPKNKSRDKLDVLFSKDSSKDKEKKSKENKKQTIDESNTLDVSFQGITLKDSKHTTITENPTIKDSKPTAEKQLKTTRMDCDDREHTFMFSNNNTTPSVMTSVDVTVISTPPISPEDFLNILFQKVKCGTSKNGHWQLEMDLPSLKSNRFLTHILNIPYLYRDYETARGKARITDELVSIFSEMCSFQLTMVEVPSENRMHELSNLTPGNGFCYYLMHYQAKLYLLHLQNHPNEPDDSYFPEITKNFQNSEEFKCELQKEIEYRSTRISQPYGMNFTKQYDEEMLLKMNKISEILSDNRNVKFLSGSASIDTDWGSTIHLWGDNWVIGRTFLEKDQLCFPMFYKEKESNQKSSRQIICHSYSSDSEGTNTSSSSYHKLFYFKRLDNWFD
jgi:hypothetical protein